MNSRFLGIAAIVCCGVLASFSSGWSADPPGNGPPPQTYMPLLDLKSFESVRADDLANLPALQQRMQALLDRRYDLGDKPSPVKMSAGRKAVQFGVRVRPPQGETWESLANKTPEQIKGGNLFPEGFRPLPHINHPTGGQVFPPDQIRTIKEDEGRDLDRFDAKFDLPAHLIPEFPPPIYLTTHPELGDVSQGKAVTIANYYDLFVGKITPVQMEGLRLLVTPFPQQQFNPTADRKILKPGLGVTCFDCHTNGHTNGAFHLTPDIRPQTDRFRLDTVSLRGVFNQQIHGSKRSLRSIEDFSEFEQRTAYFDGDHVIAMKKGVHLPNRADQVAMMAQFQNILNFPPAPKLDELGYLKPDLATESELRGQAVFMGKGKCVECHKPPFFLDDKMHDLKLERFYEPEVVLDNHSIPDGPIKTFTLRGIKDSPPYHHDGRLLTLDDTVEFFNLVLGLKLNSQEKSDLLDYLRCL
jgi:cytochrome c peroxidase